MDILPWIRENVPLAPCTTFRIGGPARWFAEPATPDEVSRTLLFARQNGLPVSVLGGGSNILVADAGVDGLVLRLAPAGEFGVVEQDADDPLRWRVGAAASLPGFVAETCRRGVSGLEKLAGIPGTVGGAVCMNCGSADSGIGRFVESATVCRDDGSFDQVTGEALCFSYRSSSLRGMVATGFCFRLAELDEPHLVMERMRAYREGKKAGQPLSVPSCGCIFKNPVGDSAGVLIDEAGCKGMREGEAEVSSIHANFIINQGQATCRDVALLAARVRAAVKASSGVELEPEVVVWGGADEFGCCGGHPNVDS